MLGSVLLQIGNVAAQPAPPFAYPMTAGAPAGKLVQKSKHSDLEMSAVPAAAAGVAGGLVPVRRAVSPIKVRCVLVDSHTLIFAPVSYLLPGSFRTV